MLGRIARVTSHVSLVVVVIASFLGYLADAWWGFELFTHFPLQYSIVLAALCVVYGLMKRLRLFVCVLCVLGLNLVQILPLYFSEEVASEGEELELIISTRN